MSNRLIHETSPYLLQHAHNPVDWYPWSDEAFEEAKARDVPVLLSIGYSACHWCHVMERESFEDPATAEVMNAGFVNIKVDREERPDIDALYMRAVQSLTGHGGWPLTAFLTPDGRPFYGGTYYPPEPRHGMPSFRQILDAANNAYRDRRDRVESSAAQIRELLERSTTERDPGSGRFTGAEGDWATVAGHAREHLRQRFDPTRGGFGGAPKFPQPDTLDFLLSDHLRTGDLAPLEMLATTLDRMAGGGIYDHLGGGFHRYSVDAEWLVPHFEKMLYDNGLLARLYANAWRVTGTERHRTVAEETLAYVRTDWQSPEGGFYSARDADSEGEEGLFYLWDRSEVRDLLDPWAADLFCRTYDVSASGNFEGRNILHTARPLEVVAHAEGIEPAELEEALSEARRVLLARRAEREAPLLDDKVLVGWNAMALRAFAEAGALFGDRAHLETARTNAEFLLDEVRVDGRLMRTWKAGVARIGGFLEDHAALGNALLSLHGATLERRWLEEAEWAADEILARFRDVETGVLWDTAHDSEALIVRPRDITDNATPSGNSLAVELFLRLGHTLDRGDLIDAAHRVLDREIGAVERYPAAFGRLLSASTWRMETPREIAIVGDPGADETRALLDVAWAHPRNARVVAGGAPDTLPSTPLFEGRGTVEGRPAAWVCERYACRAPVTDPGELAGILAD